MLEHFNRPAPRYTSYPTAPQFVAVEESVAIARYRAFAQTDKLLSIYIHIPFCESMCLFCGCSVILNRRPEKQTAYFELLLKEIELVAACFGQKRGVSQLHLGGGTPTSLTESQFEELMAHLRAHFYFDEKAELSIEIDPRTVDKDEGRKLALLKTLGFNRVSFGVQDLDWEVQEAVKRRQSEEMTVKTVELAKALRFDGVNIDLIYGLPLQTPEKFRRTAQRLIELRPDRIAFFSYAKVPWLKPHQKAIREEDLPTSEEKLQIYTDSRAIFLAAGYNQIGMDHFALATDSLCKEPLTRNFQGYAVQKGEDMIGLGVTSIGYIEGAFFQNVKTIEEYRARIGQGMLPVMRGFVLSPEDHLRRWVIQEIMCRFEIDKGAFVEKFHKPFDTHFEKEKIEELKQEGLITDNANFLRATELGRIFVRLIALAFDAYTNGQFSRVV